MIIIPSDTGRNNDNQEIRFVISSSEDIRGLKEEFKEHFSAYLNDEQLQYIEDKLLYEKKKINTVVKWRSRKNLAKNVRNINSPFNRTTRSNRSIPNPLSLQHPKLLNLDE